MVIGINPQNISHAQTLHPDEAYKQVSLDERMLHQLLWIFEYEEKIKMFTSKHSAFCKGGETLLRS